MRSLPAFIPFSTLKADNFGNRTPQSGYQLAMKSGHTRAKNGNNNNNNNNNAKPMATAYASTVII